MNERNIVLIGMSGSGKSTVGQMLAEKLNRPLLDIDAMVEAAEGRSISEIFSQEGESAFRSKEREQIALAARQKGAVIVCGGGAVIFEKNMLILEASGVIIYIDVSPELILARTDFTDRPLLRRQPEQLYDMLRRRVPLYRRHAKFTVENSGTVEETTNKIIALLQNP